MTQSDEIKTIETREVRLDLSNADVDRICKKAGEAGLTVSELLQNFIGDLIHGTYSNGSDERMHAEEWYDRCWFGMFPEQTFLHYLIRNDVVDDFIKVYKEVKSYLEGFKKDDELLHIKEVLEDYKRIVEDFAEFYKGFIRTKRSSEMKDIKLQEEIAAVLMWEDERQYFYQSHDE